MRLSRQRTMSALVEASMVGGLVGGLVGGSFYRILWTSEEEEVSSMRIETRKMVQIDNEFEPATVPEEEQYSGTEVDENVLAGKLLLRYSAIPLRH